MIAHSEAEAGDCLSACIATVLDIPLDDVPVFVASPHWFAELNEWMDNRGLALVFLQFDDGTWPWIPPDNLPLIVGGPSPRGPWGHAVVGIWRGAAMEVLHDPHPSRAGLAGEINRVYVIVPRP